ncbi:unnamed protein product [Bursaphelenchus okinawaensis]|uniref:Uncharacterized protein n=1 Tax=Bursaphelenchus okinawaensis TaxID=465554 RepID=A0A811L7N2_9BILA|nr:unnamed protein product [Bursaphelenchus okinawaensis]CAG9118407.1 unnamed protein product [Bursaphelenchus okinawaensis]
MSTMSKTSSIMTSKSSVPKDTKIKFEAPEQTRKTNDAPPAPGQVTAEKVNFEIKDEVELLRSGVMNKHGEHVKAMGK